MARIVRIDGHDPVTVCDHAGMSEGDAARLERELARLRAENARLTKLLELRGQNLDPDEQQLAAPTARPGFVTQHSTTAEKVSFFMGLFRGRTDKHAVRWENPRLGTKGWVPHVAGGWRKGMTSSTARHLPLTAELVERHLRKDGNLFIGIYPLQDDNRCHFMAADFDGATAMLDALAYLKVAAAAGVTASLELS